MVDKNIIVLLITVFIFSIDGSLLKMPSFSFIGESVTLECAIDHGDLPIKSISWSKDGKRFYKYDPNALDPVTTFDVDGVQVKKDLSLDGTRITIGSVSPQSAGLYTCNVEIDHPSLDVGEMSGTLKILPGLQ